MKLFLSFVGILNIEGTVTSSEKYTSALSDVFSIRFFISSIFDSGTKAMRLTNFLLFYIFY